VVGGTDDGSGFLPHARERSGRADADRAGDSVGVGLAIVRTIAEGHGEGPRIGPTGGAEVWITPHQGTGGRSAANGGGA
jgi:signal transduction histidine kinase